ncbi:MAG: NFACT family protein, partial [Eubacteriales bacterium]|nr:NFACT family protein [Eubacteriales bacterium]
MQIDGISFSILIPELKARLRDARIQRIEQDGKRSFVFIFRAQDRNYSLVLNFASQASALALVEGKSEVKSEQVSAFLLYLRKHFRSARLLDIEHQDFERFFTLKFEQRDDCGDLVKRQLVLEFTGRLCNMIAVSDEAVIQEALVHREDETQRVIMPARPYLAPETQDKYRFQELALDPTIIFDVRTLEAPFSRERFYDALLKRVPGLSPFYAREILLQADRIALDEELSERSACFKSLKSFAKRVLDQDFSPRLLYRDQSVAGFAFMPVL